LPLCRITHTCSYALLRCIVLSSVVCRSFCRSVSLSALQKRLKRSSCHLRSGLEWGQLTILNEVQMPTWEGAINRRTTVKYRDTPRSSVQRQLNRSRCRLGCGLVWTESIMCYMGGPDPHGKGQFWWIGAPIVKYRHFLP